jgi:hypothetical protein
MDTITLNRTGDRQLQFTGEEIATATTRETEGYCENRWWELTLYRTDSGRLVGSVAYRTSWRGEHDTDTAYVCDTAQELAETLKKHPFDHSVRGFPPNKSDKQARLMASLSACWEHGLTTVLATIEPETI